MGQRSQPSLLRGWSYHASRGQRRHFDLGGRLPRPESPEAPQKLDGQLHGRRSPGLYEDVGDSCEILAGSPVRFPGGSVCHSQGARIHRGDALAQLNECGTTG
mmetsp:Transcript_53400/g.59660  ORF Transcript_53400/g.59660 Transcript_53400/m.59660 type:complete len:103 (-) Transcript_53400:86-394(-)